MHSLNPGSLRSVFIKQLCILYNAKVNLTSSLPALVQMATFRNLKLALAEDLEETNKQMIALKTIFDLMHESCITYDCLGINAVMNEAHKQVVFYKNEHYKSDMTILFYMSVIENLQVGASDVLNLMTLKLAYQPYAQLVKECLDLVKENSSLFHYVAEEYLQ